MDIPKNEKTPQRSKIPFWRDVNVIKVFAQIIFLILVVSVIYMGFLNYQQRGRIFSFDFLSSEASFDLAEGIEFKRTDPYAKAFLVGVINTIRIAFMGIILASILGLITGIARLSNNWLVSKIATVYIEIIRNIPLLVQLFIIYFAVILQLPQLNEAIILPGSIFLSNRGIAIPWFNVNASFGIWWPFLALSVVIFIVLFVIRKRSKTLTGRPTIKLFWLFVPLIAIPLISWFVIPANPLSMNFPEMIEKSGGVLRVEGGTTLSSEYTALLFGLVIYTGTYIAEVVRAGIQAVPKGQTEAARALGLKRGKILRLIVLPQALRVIIPPLISQYLNLTKNSSLAIAIGFLDLYAVSQTILNQSGRVVEVFLMIMGSYLSISLLISFIMNIVNKKMQIKER